jgi:hypothetical protein
MTPIILTRHLLSTSHLHAMLDAALYPHLLDSIIGLARATPCSGSAS